MTLIKLLKTTLLAQGNNMEKISGVYKITNTVSGDFYIGSSKDIKRRWRDHKKISLWKRYSNNKMYQDFQKYGIDYFVFEILAEVEPDKLKEVEQQFIEKLHPTYNSIRANGWDIEKQKIRIKRYQQKSDKYKEYKKSDKYKESHRKDSNKYNNQLCFYSGETLTLNALSARFRKSGIEHPVLEAKKYLIKKESKTPIEIYDVYP